MPVVYGFSDKKVFHTSTAYVGKIHVFGGNDDSILVLNFPPDDNISVNETLSDYTKRCTF